MREERTAEVTWGGPTVEGRLEGIPVGIMTPAGGKPLLYGYKEPMLVQRALRRS
jgi:hypothetical protein